MRYLAPCDGRGALEAARRCSSSAGVARCMGGVATTAAVRSAAPTSGVAEGRACITAAVSGALTCCITDTSESPLQLLVKAQMLSGQVKTFCEIYTGSSCVHVHFQVTDIHEALTNCHLPTDLRVRIPQVV